MDSFDDPQDLGGQGVCVRVVSARDLPSAAIEAYCAVECGEELRVTRSAPASAAPSWWDTDGLFCLKVEDAAQELRIAVYDNAADQAHIGGIAFPIQDLANQATHNREYELYAATGEPRGFLHLQIAYVRQCSPEFLVTDTDFTHPLHTAAGKGYVEAVRAVLQRDEIEVDDREESSRRTALHMAAMKERVDVVELLLQSGADPNSCDNNAETPLHVACCFAPRAVPPLLAAGASVDAKDLFHGGATPLHLAAKFDQPETIPLLASAGAKLNSASMEGDTPLHFAIAGGNVECVQALMAAGADVNRMGAGHRTALQEVEWMQKHGSMLPPQALQALRTVLTEHHVALPPPVLGSGAAATTAAAPPRASAAAPASAPSPAATESAAPPPLPHRSPPAADLPPSYASATAADGGRPPLPDRSRPPLPDRERPAAPPRPSPPVSSEPPARPPLPPRSRPQPRPPLPPR